MLDFTAIDFETANSKRASVCAVGATRVRDGRIVERFNQLVHPPLGYDEFNQWNIRVHHIHPEDVAQSPSWPEVAPRLSAFIGSDTLVAHNANFDSSVMVAACEVTICDGRCRRWYARSNSPEPTWNSQATNSREYRKNSDSQVHASRGGSRRGRCSTRAYRTRSEARSNHHRRNTSRRPSQQIRRNPNVARLHHSPSPSDYSRAWIHRGPFRAETPRWTRQ